MASISTTITISIKVSDMYYKCIIWHKSFVDIQPLKFDNNVGD